MVYLESLSEIAGLVYNGKERKKGKDKDKDENADPSKLGGDNVVEDDATKSSSLASAMICSRV